MEENRRFMSNPLTKKIDQNIRRTGFDDNFIATATFHLDVILKAKNEGANSRQDLCNLLMSKLFVDKVDMYPTKRFSCQMYENSGWPVPLLPSEVFGETKLPDTYRRKCFYECLQISDILDCRVASVLPSEYQLRVIHKYGTARMLDDLNIMVVMPRNKENLLLLKNDLVTCELIRVAVSEINKDDKVIHVTVDVKNIEFRGIKAELGRIGEESIPPYVLDPPDPEKYSSYSDYLNNIPQFQNPVLLNDVFANFGIDPVMQYSFYPKFDRYKCPDEHTGQALLKESILNDVKKYAASAICKHEEKKFSEALKLINIALKICPTKDLASRLYIIRGDIYSESYKPNFSKKAVLDWEMAYSLDSSNEDAKQRISRQLYKGANGFYRMKRYKDAATSAEKACQLNSNNCEAFTLLELLKKKHPEAFDNLDEESLITLKEKRKKLVAELKKIQS